MSRKWRRSAKYFKKFFILKSHRNAYASFSFFKLSLFAFSILSIHLSKKKEEEKKKNRFDRKNGMQFLEITRKEDFCDL